MAAADSPDQAPANSPFATALRGYNQQQVDERIRKLTEEVAASARSRDEAMNSVAELTKALNYAQQELAEAKAGLTRMVNDPAGPAAMTERVQTMMRLAEEEIAELREKAEKEATETRSAADAYSEKTREEARAEAERLRNEAEQERRRLDEEAEQRRAEADRKASEELAAKRKETEDALAKRQQETDEAIAAKQAEADKRLADQEAAAKEKADTLVADAERRLAEAEQTRTQAISLRQQVTDRLAATNAAVQEAIKAFGVGEDQSAEPQQDEQGADKPAAKADKAKQPA